MTINAQSLLKHYAPQASVTPFNTGQEIKALYLY
jgi:hypothetical protein